jgi:hypothetical protein
MQSNLFRDDKRLNACLVSHEQHVTLGAVGEHVARIQVALMDLDDLEITADELQTKRYGPSTAAAVLAYKRKRHIINPAYQTTEDNIVGKMTIQSLDNDMLAKQEIVAPPMKLVCGRNCGCEPFSGGEPAAKGRAQAALRAPHRRAVT